jgi:hypothetical protein
VPDNKVDAMGNLFTVVNELGFPIYTPFLGYHVHGILGTVT